MFFTYNNNICSIRYKTKKNKINKKTNNYLNVTKRYQEKFFIIQFPSRY